MRGRHPSCRVRPVSTRPPGRPLPASSRPVRAPVRLGSVNHEIWTIGHWTCPEEVFLDTLSTVGIETVVDVRAQPGSRRSPQFSRDVMPTWLGEAGVAYVHLPELTGRRRRSPDAPPEANAGWKNQSFKNYADHGLTPVYEEGIDRLTALARASRVTLLCGEPMPWRCHRLLVSNTLVARGWTVWHLFTTAAPRRHELGAWGATPVLGADGVLTYPAEA